MYIYASSYYFCGASGYVPWLSCGGSQVDSKSVWEEDLEVHPKPAQVWHRVAVTSGGGSGGSHLPHLKRGCVVSAPPLGCVKLEHRLTNGSSVTRRVLEAEDGGSCEALSKPSKNQAFFPLLGSYFFPTFEDLLFSHFFKNQLFSPSFTVRRCRNKSAAN